MWAACKQDYALYGTEIYTCFKTETKPVYHIFIGVECPLGALPNAHTLTKGYNEYKRKDMESAHYFEPHKSRANAKPE